MRAGSSESPRRLSAAEHFTRLLARADDTRFRQIRQGIRQVLRIGSVVAVGRALKAQRIFNALLRLVGTDDPGSGVAVVLVTVGLACARCPAASPPHAAALFLLQPLHRHPPPRSPARLGGLKSAPQYFTGGAGRTLAS